LPTLDKNRDALKNLKSPEKSSESRSPCIQPRMLNMRYILAVVLLLLLSLFWLMLPDYSVWTFVEPPQLNATEKPKLDALIFTTDRVPATAPRIQALQYENWNPLDIYTSKFQSPLSVLEMDPRGLSPFSHEVQKFLFAWQNRPKEECKKAKYFAPESHGFGLASQMHVLSMQMAPTINAGAIFLYPSDMPMAQGNIHCDAMKIETMECFFMPISNCSRYQNENNTIPAPEIDDKIPRQLDQLFRTISNDTSLETFWWRAQSISYIFRMNDYTLNKLRELRFGSEAGGQFSSPNITRWPAPLPAGTIYAFVRRGDKMGEAKLIEEDAYIEIAQRIRSQDFLSVIPPYFYLGTDSDAVVDSFTRKLPAPWTLLYLNMTRIDEATNFNNGERMMEFLGPDSMYYHLLQILMAAEADRFIGQHNSNVCRLINELRCTMVPKCSNAYYEVGTVTPGDLIYNE
jgi:hypothetical protein